MFLDSCLLEKSSPPKSSELHLERRGSVDVNCLQHVRVAFISFGWCPVWTLLCAIPVGSPAKTSMHVGNWLQVALWSFEIAICSIPWRPQNINRHNHNPRRGKKNACVSALVADRSHASWQHDQGVSRCTWSFESVCQSGKIPDQSGRRCASVESKWETETQTNLWEPCQVLCLFGFTE